MVKTTSWMLEGLSNLIVGNIEMLSSPLSLLVKLPMRAILVWIKGLPTIEENKGTRFLVSRAERIIENLKNYQEEELKTQDINITEASHPLPVKMQMHELHAICYRLNEKTKKAQNYDQKMRQLKIEDIDSTLVEDLLEKKTTSLKSMEDFLGLFSLNSNKKANGINHYNKTNIPSHT